LLDDGRIRYELYPPWPDAAGVSELIFEPLELLRRLAALIPAPGTQTIRYPGLFANHSKWRPLLPPPSLSPARVFDPDPVFWGEEPLEGFGLREAGSVEVWRGDPAGEESRGPP